MDYFQYRRSPPETVAPPLVLRPSRAPSVLRLVNLALGLAATVALPGGFGWLWRIVRAHWLLPSVMQGLPPITLACARLSVMLALPASVLMLLFAAMGLHRKLTAPTSRMQVGGLAAVWIVYVAWFLASHLVLPEKIREAGDAAWIVGAMVSVAVAPFFMGAIAWGLVSAWRDLRALLQSEGLTKRSPSGLLVWALLLPLALAAPLLRDPSRPLAQSAVENDEFEALCQEVGVRLMAKPSSPVRSLAYDWDPQRLKYGRPHVDGLELDAKGRIRVIGGIPGPQSKKLDFDFTESRPDSGRSGAATIRPDAAYYRFPSVRTRQPYYGVDALSADVLLYTDANRPEELRKAPMYQGAVRYEITLTDRRSGAILGVQSYVVDRINGRACGANVDGDISQDAFIYDAIHR